MTIYIFDGTMDGLLTAVFDAFNLKEQPEQLLAKGDALPLFCDHTYQVTTDDEKARPSLATSRAAPCGATCRNRQGQLQAK